MRNYDSAFLRCVLLFAAKCLFLRVKTRLFFPRSPFVARKKCSPQKWSSSISNLVLKYSWNIFYYWQVSSQVSSILQASPILSDECFQFYWQVSPFLLTNVPIFTDKCPHFYCQVFPFLLSSVPIFTVKCPHFYCQVSPILLTSVSNPTDKCLQFYWQVSPIYRQVSPILQPPEFIKSRNLGSISKKSAKTNLEMFILHLKIVFIDKKYILNLTCIIFWLMWTS